MCIQCVYTVRVYTVKYAGILVSERLHTPLRKLKNVANCFNNRNIFNQIYHKWPRFITSGQIAFGEFFTECCKIFNRINLQL